jgi:hypothetical protein
MKFLGIDIEGKKANLSIISKGKLETFKSCNLEDVKLFYRENKPKVVTTAIDSDEVLIKNKTLLLKKRDFKRALPFQEETASSINKGDLIVQTLVIAKERDQRELAFYITKKSFLKNHLKKVEKIGIDPDFVSFTSHAQVRFAKYHFPLKNEIFLIHIGGFKTTTTLMENGASKKTHVIGIGINSNKGIKELINEVSKSFYIFIEKKNKKIPLFITGHVSKVKNFEGELLLKNSKQISEILKIKNTHTLPYAISFGLALDSYKKDEKRVQFRQKEFLPKKFLKRIGRNFFLLFFLSLLFSFLIFFQKEKIFKKREKSLRKSILGLKNFENISTKADDIEGDLEIIKKKIEKEKKVLFPFPLAPKVNSVILWVSKNELFKKENAKITYFNYRLVEYPSLKNFKKRYLVKVDLEFKTENHTVARKFHENLCKGDEMIDGKREVSWDVEKDLYKTSFFLKNLKIKDLYVE